MTPENGCQILEIEDLTLFHVFFGIQQNKQKNIHNAAPLRSEHVKSCIQEKLYDSASLRSLRKNCWPRRWKISCKLTQKTICKLTELTELQEIWGNQFFSVNRERCASWDGREGIDKWLRRGKALGDTPPLESDTGQRRSRVSACIYRHLCLPAVMTREIQDKKEFDATSYLQDLMVSSSLLYDSSWVYFRTFSIQI